MHRMVGLLLALLLALPGLRADDKPKDEPKSPKMQYDALVTEFTKKRGELITQLQKSKGEEQQKLITQYQSFGDGYADQFYKLVEANPKDPIVDDALFWVVANAPGKSQKASETLVGRIGDMPIKELSKRVLLMRGIGAPKILEEIFKKAEKEIKEPEAADLLSALAMNRANPVIGQKATDMLMEKFPEHKGIESIVMMMAYSGNPKATETLKSIVEKSKKPGIQAAASLSLAKLLSSKADASEDATEADKLATEAEKVLGKVINDFAKDNPTQLKEAERNLKALQTLRVGKPAPEISAGDLDGKEFKLSDYRGKIVLLDFWGNW